MLFGWSTQQRWDNPSDLQMIGTTGSTETSLYVEAPYPSYPVAAIRCLAFFSTTKKQSTNQLWPSPRVMAQLLNDVNPSASQRAAAGQPNLGTRVTDPQAAASVKSEICQVEIQKYMCNIWHKPKIYGRKKTQSPSKNHQTSIKIYKSYKDSPAPPKIISTIIITADSWSWVRQKSSWFGWQCSYCNALRSIWILWIQSETGKDCLSKQAILA